MRADPRSAVLCVFVAAGAFLAAGCEGGEDQPALESECLQDVQSVPRDAPLVLGFAAQEVLQVIEKPYTASVKWPDDTTTVLQATARIVSTGFVKGERNPAYKFDNLVSCRDHLLIRTDITLKTEDGQLDERLARLDLQAFDVTEAKGSRTLALGELRGKYRQLPPPERCLKSLQFNLSFFPAAAVRARGEIVGTVISDACGSTRPTTTASTGRQTNWSSAPDMP